ncbi:hypothetical protein [Bacillus sp. R86525]|uniref:hypothetical protein n=1 Tax=Bacillus sp. R86525 TaxID=3101709 RepID=UPI0036708288
MREGSISLIRMLGSYFQVGNNAPNLIVYMKKRESSSYVQIQHRVMSLEVQENADQFASTFSITFANEYGQMAPDNWYGKFSSIQEWFYNSEVTNTNQLYPQTEFKVSIGYGEEALPYIHGFVSDVKVNAESGTISVTCTTSYKKVLQKSVIPTPGSDEIVAPTGNVYDVVKFFLEKAGVTLHGSRVNIPGTNESWIVEGATGKRFQKWDEIVRDIIDTTFHYIKHEPDGSCTFMKMPDYAVNEPAKFSFREGENLVSLDMQLTDQDISNSIVVKCGDYANGFLNSFLLKNVSQGDLREEMIEVPWATTFFARRAVAAAYHLKAIQKFRTLTVAVIGDPRIQLFDVVSVYNRDSGQQWNYFVKGINTMISADDGFYQTLDLSVNYGYEPAPYTDITGITVNVDTLRLKLWDWDVEDGDLLNIYCDDKLIEENYFIRNNPTYVDIPLEYGVNTIVFEAVRNPKGILTGRLQVLDTQNNILFDYGSLPDLSFPRVNQNKDHYYIQRPAKTWSVTRVN